MIITTVYPKYQVCQEMRFHLIMTDFIVYLQTAKSYES